MYDPASGGDPDDEYTFDHAYPEQAFQEDYAQLEEEQGGVEMTSQQTVEARPATSIQAAKFRSEGKPFDPLRGGRGQPPPPLIKKSESSPEAAAREMEKKVNNLIDQSVFADANREPRLALEKAKDALRKEKALTKHREVNGILDSLNLDLTYAVYFNLANQYSKNGMYVEALNTYNLIVKNKSYAQGGRMRVNIGNIYYQQKQYKEAVKQYKMALDQIPTTAKDLRHNIKRNIGNTAIAAGKFEDAIQAFESIIEEKGTDYRAVLNLILCYFSLGNYEKMKTAYQEMLTIRKAWLEEIAAREEEEETLLQQAEIDEASSGRKLPANDVLHQEERERERLADRYILVASKLIAPVIEKDFESGFNFVVDTLNATKNTDLANELEISKALTFMKKRNVNKAIETLKEFEKRDEQSAASAATNLSFLYFLEGDVQNAEKYADSAIKSDRFNAKAYVNKGNCLFRKQTVEESKKMFEEAISCEADCIEALYNLGLVHKHLGNYEQALLFFNKLHLMVPYHAEVVFQIGSLHEMMNNLKGAEEQYKLILKSLCPTDPSIQQRLGNIFSMQGDEMHAHQYYMESYRFFPVDLNVITWLGVYYFKSEVYEKAIQYFHRASQLQPTDPKWKLVVASCHRRLRAYPKALEVYREIHESHPTNVEALKQLVSICNDLGLKDNVDEYASKLRSLESQGRRDEEESAEKIVNAHYNAQKSQSSSSTTPATPSKDREKTPRHLISSSRWDTSDTYGEKDTNVRGTGSRFKPRTVSEDDWDQDENVDDFLPL